jgi:hypothetical protein
MFKPGDKVRLQAWVTNAHMATVDMNLSNDLRVFQVTSKPRHDTFYFGMCMGVRSSDGRNWIVKQCYFELVT